MPQPAPQSIEELPRQTSEERLMAFLVSKTFSINFLTVSDQV
jgi:hypothetical protein